MRVFGGEIKRDYVRLMGAFRHSSSPPFSFWGARIGLSIEVLNPPVSKPYIEVTLRTLKRANVKVRRDGGVFHVIQGIKARHFSVPGDYSSASFFLVAGGAIFGKIRVEGLDRNDVQPDKAILDLLRDFGGAKVKVARGGYVEVERDELVGQEVDCRDFPDLFPILAVLGAYSEGRTVLRAKHLRYKESDRVRAMALNLTNMGAKLKELDDGLMISKSELRGAVLNPQNDHRIAMALTIAALGAKGRSLILNEGCVKKSYPKSLRI